MSSRLVPLHLIYPSTITATWSLSISASSIEWVVNNTTLSFFNSRTISHIYLRLTGSIPVVGSSRKITWGEFIPAIVILSLLFIPPLKVLTRSSCTFCRFTDFRISKYFYSFIGCLFTVGFRLSYNVRCSAAVNSFHRISN